MELRDGYKQTEVGVIPREWEIKSLSQVAEIRGGVAKNSNIAVADPITVHYLRVANVQDGFLNLTEMSEIQLSRGDLRRYSVLPGDMLMNEGGDLDKLGRGAIWMGQYNPCVHQNHVFVVRCRPTLLPDYLNVWTTTRPARRYFLLVGKQTTNLASISKSSLSGLPVAVPSIPEQHAIATALSDMDALLEGLDQLIAKKRDLKQAAMQQLLTGKTRLPGFEGDWKEDQLGNLAKMGSGGTPLSSVAAFYDGDIPWVAISDMTKGGKITERTERNLTTLGLNNSAAQVFPAGTVLYAMYASLGECSIAGDSVCTSQAILGIQANDSLNANFLYYYLTSLKQIVKTLGQQGTQSNLNKGMVQDFRINLPSVTEQDTIATILSDMDTEIEALQQRRAKTRDLKQAMMQELLTGRTRLLEYGEQASG